MNFRLCLFNYITYYEANTTLEELTSLAYNMPLPTLILK